MRRTTWRALFERGEAIDATEEAVERALRERRAAGASTTEDDPSATPDDGDGGPNSAGRGPDERREPSPAAVVADADVLVADVLVGGDARRALDHLREHSWTALVASDPLLDDAEAVLASLSKPGLAADWRGRIEAWRTTVTHPAADHPALASAYRGGAMHLLSFDDRLTGAKAGAALSGRVPLSVRRPDAFAALFDAESLYLEVAGEAYPGPDCDPRS